MKKIVLGIIVILIISCTDNNNKYYNLFNINKVEYYILTNDINNLKNILKEGYTVNKVNSKGYPPIWIALQYKRWDMIKLLIENGSDISFNRPANIKEYDIYYDVLEELLKNGRQDLFYYYIDNRLEKYGEIFDCIHIIPADYLEKLIKKGMDINVIKKYGGNSYYEYSIIMGRYDLAVIFIKYGAKINDNNDFIELSRTNLRGIKYEKYIYDLANLLVKKGIPVNKKNEFGIGGLGFSIGHGYYFLTKALLENGASLKEEGINNEKDLIGAMSNFKSLLDNSNESEYIVRGKENISKLYEDTFSLVVTYIKK